MNKYKVKWKGNSYIITHTETKKNGLGLMYYAHLEENRNIKVRFDGLDIGL